MAAARSRQGLMPRLCRGEIAPRRLALRPSAHGGCLLIWNMQNSSLWSPVGVVAVLSTRSIACTCSSCISRAGLDAMRATPALLALGPSLHPVCEGRIAVVLRSRNFTILPTTLAVLYAAPLLLLR